MKTVKTKSKSKKTNGKFEKTNFVDNLYNGIAHTDFSSLRKPIDTSVSSLYQVTKLLNNGSDEVKDVLSYECDIIYECRICRSLFRSLVNFISHKRVYCKEKFNIVIDKNVSQNHDLSCNFRSLSPSITLSESTNQLQFEGSSGNGRILRSHVAKGETKKDLTNVIDMLQRKHLDSSGCNNCEFHKNTGKNIEQLESNRQHLDSAMFTCDSAQSVTEIENMLTINKNTSEIDHDMTQGSFVQANDTHTYTVPVTDNVVRNQFVCSTCHATFYSKKKLTLHTKSLHTSCRVYYSCPCCLSTFSNTWSVYRHLFKVHRKSNDQVRQLRKQIQGSAFRKEVAKNIEDRIKENEKNKVVVLDHKVDCYDNHEPLTNSNHQKCYGERRSTRKGVPRSLSQLHSTVDDLDCASRTTEPAALSSSEVVVMINDTSIHNDADSSKSSFEKAESNMHSEDKSNAIEDTEINIPIRVQNVISLNKTDWDKISNERSFVLNPWDIENNSLMQDDEPPTAAETALPLTDTSDDPEIVFTNTDECEESDGTDFKRKRKKNSCHAVSMDTATGGYKKMRTDESIIENNYTVMMESKIAAMANLRKLQCLSCKQTFNSTKNLRKHLAAHVGWYRYRCALCDFRSFLRADLVTHCNELHNAENSRVLIEGMIARISHNNTECSEGQIIPMALEDTETTANSLKVTDDSNDDEDYSAFTLNKKSKTMAYNESCEISNVNNTVKNMKLGITAHHKRDNDARQTTQLDINSGLRRMVMEVIFGNTENESEFFAGQSTLNYPTKERREMW